MRVKAKALGTVCQDDWTTVRAALALMDLDGVASVSGRDDGAVEMGAIWVEGGADYVEPLGDLVFSPGMSVSKVLMAVALHYRGSAEAFVPYFDLGNAVDLFATFDGVQSVGDARSQARDLVDDIADSVQCFGLHLMVSNAARAAMVPPSGVGE